MNEIAVNDALTIIKEIRGIVNRAQGTKDPVQEKRRLTLALVIQGIAFVLGLFFWTGEVQSGLTTQEFARSAIDANFRTQGLVSLAALLFMAVATLYALIRFEARNSADSLQGYLRKHFPTLLTLNFLSDLIVKYAAITAVILALKPEFISPLLLVFLADYLIQGRFFVLPFWISIPAAFVYLAVAALQIQVGDPSMLWAFTGFLLCCASSAVYLALKLISILKKEGE